MLADGRFRARVDSMGLQCRQETTLHVRASAAGYQAVEHEFVVAPGAALPELDLRLEPTKDAEVPREPVMRSRLPEGFSGPGLVSWWFAIAESDALNTAVCRGVPVSSGGHVAGWSVVGEDALFELRGPWLSRCALCLQRPGMPVQWFLPAAEAAPPRLLAVGAITGRITGMPETAHGHCYAVLFGRGVIRRVARAERDGTFTIDAVPAGVFHLRAGDDDFARVRGRLRDELGLEDGEGIARPSVGAVPATVRAGETTCDVEVPFDGN